MLKRMTGYVVVPEVRTVMYVVLSKKEKTRAFREDSL